MKAESHERDQSDKQMRGLLKIGTYGKVIRDISEKDMSHPRQDMRSLRWFILLWVSTVSLWGSAQLLLNDYVRFPFGGVMVIMSRVNQQAPVPRFFLSAQSSGQIPSFFNHVPYPIGVIAVLFMAIQFGLHWICLSGRLQRHWYWVYFLLQGLCVLAVGFIWSDTIIALGFYLVLVIEALSLLKQTRHIVIAAVAYLLLFASTIVWQVTQAIIFMTLESILFLVIFFIGWIILSIQQVRSRDQLEAAHLQLAAYAMRMEELTLVNERQRLARELHDTLAQDLVGLTLHLERIDLHLEKKRFERARELVQQAMTRARATLAEARSAIDDLRATTLDSDDLLQAVQREINRFTEATSIPCVADIHALAATPESLCEHVLRAITEGLTNVARHSQAHQVWICAQLHGTTLTIEVRDDGAGFESAAGVGQKGHYGLLGLRERARLCGGHLDIESAVGKGTLLRLHLPVKMKGDLE